VSAELLLTTILGAAGLLITGIGLQWQIRKSTNDDRQKAAEKVADDLRDARVEVRTEERDRCADQIRQRDARIAELTGERDRAEARADSLQNLINERGLGTGRQ
jgi:hypothetical protein